MSLTTSISVAFLGKKKRGGGGANLLIKEMDRMRYIEFVKASVGFNLSACRVDEHSQQGQRYSCGVLAVNVLVNKCE